MSAPARYRSFVADNARWDAFRFRAGDIVISTPPKCGTTWTQMLCAMLLLDTPDLPRPLAELSPWLDMQTRPIDEVIASLEAQQHRRFIKTHTPLDGLPFDERATYLCVGRDPRDAALSWGHHLANMDFDALVNARSAAVGLDDLAELGDPPPPPPEDPLDRFHAWADADTTTDGTRLAGMLHHLRTFWDRRDEPNVWLFHYADLSSDLPGEMRRLADVLGIEVSDGRIAELAAAASFARMRERASLLAPDVGNRIWRSDADFFHRGTSGQWVDLLDEESVARYHRRVAELVDADLAAWVHGGRLGSTGTGAPTGNGLDR